MVISYLFNTSMIKNELQNVWIVIADVLFLYYLNMSAQMNAIGWIEYWSFSNSFLIFSCSSGIIFDFYLILEYSIIHTHSSSSYFNLIVIRIKTFSLILKLIFSFNIRRISYSWISLSVILKNRQFWVNWLIFEFCKKTE